MRTKGFMSYPQANTPLRGSLSSHHEHKKGKTQFLAKVDSTSVLELVQLAAIITALFWALTPGVLLFVNFLGRYNVRRPNSGTEP